MPLAVLQVQMGKLKVEHTLGAYRRGFYDFLVTPLGEHPAQWSRLRRCAARSGLVDMDWMALRAGGRVSRPPCSGALLTCNAAAIAPGAGKFHNGGWTTPRPFVAGLLSAASSGCGSGPS